MNRPTGPPPKCTLFFRIHSPVGCFLGSLSSIASLKHGSAWDCVAGLDCPERLSIGAGREGLLDLPQPELSQN